MPGFHKTDEEVERLLLRAIRRGGGGETVSAELAAWSRSHALRQASEAVARAAKRNRDGAPLLPPAGWFPPPS